MNKRRERTLQDLCDVTPTLSKPQITPVLSGNFRMQGPVDEANRDLLTHMVKPENSKGFSSCCDRSQKVEYTGKSGTCNVCSAPCSSCFHVNKVLLGSTDESAGETCAENTEIGQLSVLSAVAGMNSTSDSFSENAVGKASSRTSHASASDDSVVHSKSESRRVPEGHDDCLSCVSGTDEHANKKSDTEDSKIYNNLNKCSGESSDKVLHSSSQQTGLNSQNPDSVGVPFSKYTDDATDLLKGQNAFSQASNEKYLSHEPKPRAVTDNKQSDIKDEPLEGSTEHLDSSLPRGVASDIVSGDPPPTVLNSVKKDDEMEVEVHPVDETDDSDMVEHDVKVCDICGDAGREDLLAICCRCSDGAEHTYCMREMMEKVPEGEWLCEECKTMDQEGVGRQEKNGGMDENEKNNSSGQASSEYVNGSDVEGPRTKGYMRIPCKRHRDDADSEVSSIAKKPALEPTVRSPKTSSSSKLAALSRENSLKYTDKGRLQSSHHSSSDTVPVNDTTESASSASNLRVNTSRGTFSKSKSFNSLNSKPKVKLVDQVVIQRQKSAKEHGSFRLKEGVVRAIGKSMSFKCTNSMRSESKLKMLSPRPTHSQDSKSTKQRTPFERHHSFKAELPSANPIMGTSMSSTSRIEKKQASRAESSSLATVANHHDMKPVQTDGRSAALTRSSGLAARRTAELSSSQGEFKRPSVYGNHGVSSAGGVNNIEQKSNRTSLKEDAASSVVADRPPLSASEVLPDGSPRPGDLTSSGERMKEYSSSRFGQSSVKSLRDESDNLKAAIEAAVLRKPGVYRKHRALGQSDESSISSVACEVASHHDHISSSAGNKKLASNAELSEVSRNSTPDHLKQETISSVKQSLLVPVEGLPFGARDGVHNGPFSRDVFSNAPAAVPAFLKYLAIPEHEHIWQGSFEICRSDETFDSWDGIQAHLSTSASPKVIKAVNKFKSRIVLYEVPRKSTWPIQFQECGVREDNIALFFFAKDLESYEKIYKVLLDNMMKKDLALRGNVNGVELLIFASNQLPDKSQRWNMLFFLWGVFRGKKESCLQKMPESLNQCCAPRDIPPPIMSLPENRCSLGPITEDLLASEDASPVLDMPASEELRNLLSSRAVASVSSLDSLNHRPNPSSTVAGESESTKQCQEREGGISSSCSPHLPVRSSSCSGREQMMHDTRLLDRQQSSHHSSKSVAGELKEGTGEGTLLDKSSKICNQNQVKLSVDAGDLSTGGETPLEDHQETRDLNVEHRRWPFNNDSMHPASPVVPRTLYAGTSKVPLRNDDARNETCGVLEKINHVPSGSYALHNRHQEVCVETLIPGFNEHAERRFFPIEQPVKGVQSADGSTPWKMHQLEPDRLNDRAPNLELALGADIKPLSLGTRSVLVSKVDQTVNEEHIREEARSKTEDDVSASLSLSLSFPFPEKEFSTKPAPKTEQLVSERERVNTSMLLFGNLRDN
ncbi:uncharacterized protein LOC105166844 [Sesamum indicum]|uniref:Uncharacterized protein LOC105166844 n=1 Tax=Sesamum indicum TaxID=4182 RepID=A0A6I9TTP0_SESIN|nr:uncharacterized protein LOC105166844 [Sesamum indicum]